MPEHTTLGECPVGGRDRAGPDGDRWGGRGGQQQLDPAGRTLPAGGGQQLPGRGQLLRGVGQQVGRIAQLEQHGETGVVGEHRGRTGREVGGGHPRARGGEPEHRGDLPGAGVEPQTRGEPLERPALAGAQPGEGEHESGEDHREQTDGTARGEADQDEDGGCLGGDDLVKEHTGEVRCRHDGCGGGSPRRRQIGRHVHPRIVMVIDRLARLMLGRNADRPCPLSTGLSYPQVSIRGFRRRPPIA